MTTDNNHGARRAEAPTREGYGFVDLPDTLGPASLHVVGHSYDDEEPSVEVRALVDDVTLRVELPVEEAEAVRDDLQHAITHARGQQ